jgi:hypothetical protein
MGAEAERAFNDIVAPTAFMTGIGLILSCHYEMFMRPNTIRTKLFLAFSAGLR